MPLPSAQEVWEEVTSEASLGDYLDSRITNTTAPGRDGTKKSHVPKDLVASLSRSLAKYEHRFSTYRLVLQSKGPDKAPRPISIPSIRDRLVFRAMLETLVRTNPDLRGRRPQHAAKLLADSLSCNNWSEFVKFDIQNCYARIDHAHLGDELHKALDLPPLELLFRDAVSTPTASRDAARSSVRRPDIGVPQGLAISNALAELVLQPVDSHLGGLQGAFGLRYVDDIAIVGHTDLDASAIRSEITRQIRPAGLELHDASDDATAGKADSGTITSSNPLFFVGYSLTSSNNVGVRTASIRRLENRLARSFTTYKHSRRGMREQERLIWNLNLVIAGCIYKRERRGWLSYFSHMNDYGLLRHLNHMVSSLWRRHGLPTDRREQVYSFVDSLHEARRISPNTGFVINFDSLGSLEQRRLLATKFSYSERELSRLSDCEVSDLYHKQIKKVVDGLERDVSSVS